MSLGKNLQQFRKSRRLSLKELAALTNLSISFLSDIEHERSYPSLNNLELLSQKLNIPISALLEDKTPPSNYSSVDLSDIIQLLDEFNDWKLEDKLELFYYLRAKKTIRDSNENPN